MRLRGYDESTEELSDDLKNITGDIADLTKTASNGGKGVSLFTDESRQTYKSTYEIIKEISKIWNELSDKNQAELLEKLAGKRNSQVVAAAIQNFATAEKAMNEMANSQGNAMSEMAIAYESISYRINMFKESLVGLGQTIFEQDALKWIIDRGNDIIEGLDTIIEKVGVLPTILSSIATIKIFKNVGVFKVVDNNLTTIFNKAQTVTNGFNLASDSVNSFVRGFNRLNSEQNFGNRWDSFINGATSANANMAVYFEDLAKQGASARASVEGVYAAILDGNTRGIGNVKSVIATFNSLNPDNQKAFANAVGQTNAQLGNYLANVQAGTASTRGYAIQLGIATAKTTALKIASTALNAVISVGISIAITGLIKLLSELGDKIVVTKKELEEAAQERKEAALSEIESMKSESSQIDSLIEKYTEYATTTADLTTVKNELTDVQSQLNDVFGEEKSEIDLLNKSYAENIKLINEKKKAESEKFLRDNKQAYDDANKFLEQDNYYSKGMFIDGQFEKIGNPIELKALGFGNWGNKTLDSWSEIAKNANANLNIDSSGNVYLEGKAEEQLNALKAIYDSYEKQIAGLDDKKYKDRLNAIGNALSELEKQYNDATTVVKEFNEQQDYVQDVTFFEDENKNNSYKKLTNDLIELNQKFEETNSTAKKLSLIKEINSGYDELQKLVAGNKTAEESVESLFNSFNSNLTQYINSISASASTYKSTLADYTENGFKTATENIDTFKTALQSLNDDGYISAETMWKLVELDSSLADSFVQVADGFAISSDKIISSKDELINKELDYARTEKITSQQIINNLKLRLQAVQKEKEIELKYLQDNGANSAWDVNRVKQYDSEIQEINDSIAEVEETAKKWNLVTEQIRADLGDTVSITDKLESQSKSIEDNIDKIQDKIDSINDEIGDLEDKQSELLEYQEYQIDKIIDKIEDEKESLEKEKEILEEQVSLLEEQQDEIENIISTYEKVVDVISDVVDKEIEAIENEKDAIEKHYDDMISKLQEQNEEREKAISLAEKQANLENAQRNKVRQYNEQTGWTYTTNAEAVSNAQNDLNSLKSEMQIDSLEKEKENALKGFDKQIDSWKEYLEQWNNTVDEYSDNQDRLIAEQILGSDWLEKIKNKDTDTLTTFKNNYNSYQNTLNNVIKQEIDGLKQSIKAKEDEIQAKEKQIESWSEYKNELSDYVENVSKKWSDYIENMNQIALDENSSLEDRTYNFETFKNNYNSIADEILAKQGELASATSELESAQEQLNQINAQIEESANKSEIIRQITAKQTDYANEKSRWDYYNSLGIRNAVDGAYINDIADSMRKIQEEIQALYASIGIDYIPHYATGGVNTTTGFAWLDGTPNKPELVLNNSEAAKLYNLLNKFSTEELYNKFHFGEVSPQLQMNLKALGESTTINKKENTQNITLNFNGNIVTNNPVDFMKQMNSYIQHNKLNGRIDY